MRVTMVSFLKLVLGNLFALCLVGLLSFFLLSASTFNIFGSPEDEKEKRVRFSSKKPKVLKITLSGRLVEKRKDKKFSVGRLLSNAILKRPESGKYGLLDYLLLIESAKENEKIQGISLEIHPSFRGQGMATFAALRGTLQDFKDSGKFVDCYFPKRVSEVGYYLASVADHLAISPMSGFEFNGFQIPSLFFKGFADKYGIGVEATRSGPFKGAAESYVREAFSEENRQQLAELLHGLYDEHLSAISQSRGVPVALLRTLAGDGVLVKAEDALQHRLVDAVVYPADYEGARDAFFCEKLGLAAREEDAAGEPEDKPEERVIYAGLDAYEKKFKVLKDRKRGDHQIAMVVAEGEISLGGEGGISYDEYKKIFSAIRENKKIKAVVVRINSPGGSAHASDLLWREIKLTAEKVPVVASMSGLAASGGYYMAMACDAILAEKTTITGSIGVINVSFNVEELFGRHGVSYDVVKTGKYADSGCKYRAKSEEERLATQRRVDRFYDVFIEKAASGRSMEKAEVLAVAGGRVWMAPRAQGHGLVDGIGGWQDAVKLAAEKASVTDYAVRYYPEYEEKKKGLLGAILPRILGQEPLPVGVQALLLRDYLWQEFQNRQGMQARMLYDLSLN